MANAMNILLTQGHVAIVDADDFERASKHSWHAHKHGNVVYARTNIQRKKVYLHHFILGVGRIDHKNHNGLDCRKDNLRFCNQSQNIANARRRHDNSSGVKGVGWDAGAQKWRAYIRKDGKKIHLGYHADIANAIAARERASVALFGEFACVG